MASLSFPSPTQLKNISAPTDSTDAATKSYVDSAVGSGGTFSTANISASGNISATGNVSGGNITTGGNANVTGNVTANYFIGNGSQLTGVVASSASTATSATTSITVTASAQPNITSVGTLTSLDVSGNVTVGNISGANLIVSNYFSGNGSSLTGLSLNDSQFTDVSTSSPTTGQLLGYNGTYWTNVNNTGSISAGPGVDFWLSSPIINSIGANTDIQIDTLSTAPNTSAQTYTNVTVNGTGVIAGFVSSALGRTIMDAGNWDFSIWANINNTSGSSTIKCGIYEVLLNAGTVTITGTGTSRTVTASGGTPFASVVAGNDVILSSYIQTSLGMYRITAKTSDTVVTINTPSTYTNQTTVAASVWIPLFNVGSTDLKSTSFTEYLFGTTQPAYNITTDSAIGVLLTATTPGNRTINVTIDGTQQASHFSTPLHILHKDLAGLQGGSSTEYYHLTNSEYTGTGTGNFVRKESPSIANASITGELTASNVSFTGANVSLGSISNLNITGGSAGYLLKTDGTGNLSWGADSSSLNSYVDEFTGDGSNVSFTLSTTPSNKNFTFAVVQGVMQPKSSYSVTGAVLTFSSAPPLDALVEVTTMKLG
jgi:hypothetical protein